MTAQQLEETYFAAARAARPSFADRRRDRVSARAAFQETLAGTLLVDIRGERQRAAEGTVPGAVVVDRVLLGWRLDPRGETRLPEASYDARMIVLGDELAAVRAAADLRDLGIAHATYLRGGFPAWREAGMPVSPASAPG